MLRSGLIHGLVVFSVAWPAVALARDFSGKYQSSAVGDHRYLEIVGPNNRSAKNFFIEDGDVVGGMKDLYALSVSGNVLDFRNTGCVSSDEPGTEDPSTKCTLAKNVRDEGFVAPDIRCIASRDGKVLKCAFKWPQGNVEHSVLHKVRKFTYPRPGSLRPCDCKDLGIP